MQVLPQFRIHVNNETRLVPDFVVLDRTGALTIVDIKLPTSRTIVGRPRRRRLSAAVADGLAQLREYRAAIQNTTIAEAFTRRYGHRVVGPSVSLVIGRCGTG